MTLTNDEVIRLNAKVFSVPCTSVICVINLLSSNESSMGDNWTNARRGQIRVDITEHEGSKFLTLSFQLLANNVIGRIITKLSVADSMKIEESSYTATGRFNTPSIANQMELAVADTAIYLGEAFEHARTFETTNENRVYRTEFIRDDPEPVLADIQHDNFRNLLNKLGKESGVVHLFSKGDTFAGVLGEENQCLASYYKAGNVATNSDAQCAVGYSELYDLLYRRKASHAGLYHRVLLSGENVRLGIKPNGNLVIGVTVNDHVIVLEKPSEVGSLTESIDISSAEISTKKTRRSSTSVKPSKVTQKAETVIVEEPVDTEAVPVENTFTEHEQNLIEQWRRIHLAAGGVNTSPSAWFRDYCMHQIRSGLEIPQEHLDLASRL